MTISDQHRIKNRMYIASLLISTPPPHPPPQHGVGFILPEKDHFDLGETQRVRSSNLLGREFRGGGFQQVSRKAAGTSSNATLKQLA